MYSLIAYVLRKMNLVPVPFLDVQPRVCLARAILEANRFGVFTALGNNNGLGLTAPEIAERVGMSPEGAEVLLTVLKETGYLELREGRFQNGPVVKKWILDPKHGMPNRLALQLHGWQRLSDLDVILKTGHPSEQQRAIDTAMASETYNYYTMAMRETARALMPSFIKYVELPPGARTLLDIGGAHGDYSRALIKKFPDLRATVMDLEDPIATARKLLAAEDQSGRIELRVGDALKDDLGVGWDVVLLNNVIHVFSRDENQGLFRRIHSALNPGGVLIVMDQFFGLGRRGDRAAALMSLNYFTAGGRCYRWDEIQDLIKDTGFERVKLKAFVRATPTALIFAWKGKNQGLRPA